MRKVTPSKKMVPGPKMGKPVPRQPGGKQTPAKTKPFDPMAPKPSKTYGVYSGPKRSVPKISAKKKGR